MSSLFDDLSKTTTDLQSADDKTLRLASPPLSEPELQALVRYQEDFLAHAEQPGAGPHALAEAHQLGLQAAGLKDVKAVEQGSVLLRTFCGRRWTVQRLKTRLVELEAGGDSQSAERAAKVREELERLEDLDPLMRRWGAETVALLYHHEERLLALHVRLSRVLGQR
jgi:hypothetical protein